MENNIKEIACLGCGAKDFSFFTKKDNFDLYRCGVCGHGMVYPMPDNLAAIYGEDYFAGAEEGFGYVDYDGDKEPMRPLFTRELVRAEEHIKDSSREILDIGAATGFFLDIAQERGWSVRGVEISPFAAQAARNKGIDVTTGILSDAHYEQASFDTVTMWDVIEHVQEPVEELKKVHTILKQGGLLLMTTPNFSSWYAKLLGSKWHAIVPPEHLHYFTFKSMEHVLNEAQFEVISITAPLKSFTFEYIFQILARWQGLGIWKYLAEFLKRHPKLGTLSIPIPLGDNMLVFARKK